MLCELEAEQVSKRGHHIAEMLLPITGSKRVAFSVTPQRNEIVIAVHSGERPDFAPRDWRFTTPIRRIRGSYFERWVPTDETRRTYYLTQAYLHLYWRERIKDEERELLALHCDPNEPHGNKHAEYKKGPHIHVMAAMQPLPHAHFALNLGHLAQVLGSVETLSGAVGSGVTLIRDQVLDLFQAHGS